MKIEDFEMMLPMKYFDKDPDGLSAALAKKRQDMLDNKDNLYIATEKNDGEWACFIHYTKGHNLIRSRSISVKTGKYGDKTELLPHLVEEMDNWPDNSVILGEVCWGEHGTVSTDVGQILRCLAPKAIKRQEEKKLVAKVFDILMWDNVDMTKTKYIKRLEKVDEEFNTSHQSTYCYFTSTNVFFDNFAEAADNIIADGGEGIVIQRKDNEYLNYQKTAVSWATLKVKQKLPEMELKVVGVIEPKMNYEGDEVDTWKYWYQDTPNANSQLGDFPVTKPYFMGWKVGVSVQLENGTICDVTSGTSDADREWLASKECVEQIANGELYAVIKGMMVASNGAIRHPVLVRLRNDM